MRLAGVPLVAMSARIRARSSWRMRRRVAVAQVLAAGPGGEAVEVEHLLLLGPLAHRRRHVGADGPEEEERVALGAPLRRGHAAAGGVLVVLQRHVDAAAVDPAAVVAVPPVDEEVLDLGVQHRPERERRVAADADRVVGDADAVVGRRRTGPPPRRGPAGRSTASWATTPDHPSGRRPRHAPGDSADPVVSPPRREVRGGAGGADGHRSDTAAGSWRTVRTTAAARSTIPPPTEGRWRARVRRRSTLSSEGSARAKARTLHDAEGGGDGQPDEDDAHPAVGAGLDHDDDSGANALHTALTYRSTRRASSVLMRATGATAATVRSWGVSCPHASNTAGRSGAAIASGTRGTSRSGVGGQRQDGDAGVVEELVHGTEQGEGRVLRRRHTRPAPPRPGTGRRPSGRPVSCSTAACTSATASPAASRLQPGTGGASGVARGGPSAGVAPGPTTGAPGRSGDQGTRGRGWSAAHPVPSPRARRPPAPAPGPRAPASGGSSA